jgi:hypothetical protein
MSANGAGDRVCSSWVRWYTRRVPEEVATARRAEIASDLWEHRQDAVGHGRSQVRHDLAVIWRVLGGVPADLSWRRGVIRSQIGPATGVAMASSRTASLTAVLLIVFAVLGVSIAATPLPWAAALMDGFELGGLLWGLGSLAFGAALFVGLLRRLNGTMGSTMLLVVGSPAPSVAWFWLPPVYLLTVAIAVTALMSRPRRDVPLQPAT